MIDFVEGMIALLVLDLLDSIVFIKKAQLLINQDHAQQR